MNGFTILINHLKGMAAMIYLILFILLITGLSLVIASKCEDAFFHPTPYSKEHEFEVLPTFGYDVRPFYESVKLEEFSLESPNGYTIKGSVIRADDNTSFPDGKRRAVIMSHGVTANRYTMLSHGEIWHRLGFDLVIYDQRAHGESGGPDCSFGYYESKDLVYIAEEMRKRFPEDTIWGIGGESMGAATVMMAAPHIPWLSFVYEDGGYATFRAEIPAALKHKKNLPYFPFTPLTILFINHRHEFKVDDVRPVDSVKDIHVPMLFVHGGDDRFVPTENVYPLYEAKQGDKELKIFEGAPHVKAVLMHHEEYCSMLKGFCEKYGII